MAKSYLIMNRSLLKPKRSAKLQTKMAQTLRIRHIIVGLAMFVAALIFLLWAPAGQASGSRSFPLPNPAGLRPSYGPGYHGRSSPAEINRATNSTLGFSKIFVIGLPERTDKRDAMVLTSSLTGFNLDFIDGVKGESVPDKAFPFGRNREDLPNAYLGSWRSHMNAVRRQVSLHHAASHLFVWKGAWSGTGQRPAADAVCYSTLLVY